MCSNIVANNNYKVVEMDIRIIRSFTFFFVCLFLSSDPSIAGNFHKQESRITRKLEYEKIPVETHPSLISETQLDTIPIIDPNPTTGTPIIILESPPPPLTTATPTIPTVPTTPTTSSGGSWCVASQSASDTALQVALDYACGYGGADCSAIQPGASCANPNTIRNHASYAFNEYYQKNPSPMSCVFGGTASLTHTDPSSGTCHYPSSGTSTSTPTTPPPPPPTPTMMTPSPPTPTMMTPSPPTPTMDTPSPPAPSTSSPMNPYYNPTTPTVYGEGEPTESPNSANLLSHNLILIFTITVFPNFMINSL